MCVLLQSATFLQLVRVERYVDVAERLLFLEEQTQKFQARNRWFSVVTLMLGMVG